jgi:PKD repeat protein/5-hydroxyisourate hydrolase-like protein (transthyretin family)
VYLPERLADLSIFHSPNPRFFHSPSKMTMRRIITILTTLSLLLASQISQAQVSELNIGIVIRDQSSAPIPFQSFDLQVIGNISGPLYTLTAFTDASGYFQDTLLAAPPQQGTLLLSTTDCQGLTVNDTLSFNDSAFQYHNFDLTICNSGANCQAGFTFNTTGQAVDFTNTSTAGPNATYFWDFGDNTSNGTSTLPNPSYTYGAPGAYAVSLTVTDSTAAGVCTDTYLDVVVINGNSYCDATFSNVPFGQNIYQFEPFIPDNGQTFDWSISLNGSPVLDTSAYSFTYQFSSIDTFEICLEVSDTACFAQYCTTLVTSPALPCQADFTWNSLGGNSYQFTNLSNVGNSSVFAWSFGDGGTSTLASPTHTYSGSGPWTVSLAAIDLSTGCLDTVSYQIGSPGGSNYSISGAVIADSTMQIFDGVVYLIKYDSASATLSAVDSTLLFGSFYQFSNVAPGDYLVKAALLPGSPYYANYLPTYLGDEFFWFDAQGTVVTNGNVINPDIHLLAGSNPGGPGFIGGSVAQGANKTTGDPVSNVSVLIFTANEEPVEHVKTDIDGNFSFDNLPFGTYHLYVDMMNHYSERHVITLTPDEPSSEQAIFEVIGNDVVATSLAIDLLADGITVYPNPASDRLQVAMTLTQPAQVSMRLINLMGQVLRQKSMGQRQGRLTPGLRVSELPAGIYTLEVQTDEQVTTQRIVIRR